MKILLVQNTDYIKRNPAQQHHLMELLSLRGHEIRVIDFEILWRDETEKEFKSERKVFANVSKIHRDAKVTVIRPGIIKVPTFDYLSLFYGQKKEIERQINEFKPDILVSLGIVSYIAGKAAKKHNLPFLYYWIDVSHRLIPFKFLQPIGWLIERKTLKIADKILTINERLKEYVIKRGSDPETTEVVSAGIYIDKFNPSISGDRIRREYGIKEDDTIILFMGWLYEFSGLKEVSLELAKNKDKYPNFKFLVVGDGDVFNKLKEIKNKYKQDENLILTGKMPYEKIPEFISASDVCILPAYPDEKIMRDIVPIKIYEYMAMGKPVITTKLPGVMKEFGDDNGISYVEKPSDVLKKASSIDISTEGEKSRRFAEENDWGKITDEFERNLIGLIGERNEKQI
jgi:glycosyltransferase involved in cell wall biosynthesis